MGVVMPPRAVAEAPRLGLGVPAAGAADSVTLIRTALSCGTRFFVTDISDGGRGEAMLGMLGSQAAAPFEVSTAIFPAIPRDARATRELDAKIEESFTASLRRLKRDRIDVCRLDGALSAPVLDRACTVLEQFIAARVLGHLSVEDPPAPESLGDDYRELLAAHPTVTEFTFRPARPVLDALRSHRSAARRYGVMLVERWRMRHFGGLLDSVPLALRHEARRYRLPLALLPLIIGIYTPEVAAICVEDVTPVRYADACRIAREVNPDSHLMQSVCAQLFG